MPRTFGDASVHVSHFDTLVEGHVPMPEHKAAVLTEVEVAIGKHIAQNLVEDGATLQVSFRKKQRNSKFESGETVLGAER